MEVFLVKKGFFVIKKGPYIMFYIRFQTVKTDKNRENTVDN